MSVVCLGSWRTLCTALRIVSKEQPGPLISKWAMIIHRAQSSQLGPSGPPSPSYSQHTIAHSRLRQSQSCARYSVTLGNKHFPRPFSSGSQLCNAASKPSKPKGSLSQDKVFSAEKIRSILGNNADTVKGNAMLHLVQEQRLAGTIDRAVPGSRLHKDRALAWLRRNYPLDEEKAIHDRLDREDEAAAQPQAWHEGQTSVYGDSVLNRWKKENIAKQERREAEEKARREAEEKARREAEEKARREAEAKEVPVSGTTAVAQRPSPSLVWAQKHRKAVEDSGLQSVPHMSFLQRVGPITLMTVTILSICVLFAQHYIPPSRAARLLSDIPPAAATVGGLIAINVTMWLAWKVPSLWRPLTKYFLLCPVYPYAASILGNNFSHQALHHLSVNMVVLWFMGTSLHEDIGRGPFLAVYIACGVTASYVFLLHTVVRGAWSLSSLGCSGVLSGILAAWCCINSDKGLRIWPLPPAVTEMIQPLFVLAAFIAWELWVMRKNFRLTNLEVKTGRVDHVSHLAGYGSGVVAAQFLHPSAMRKRRKAEPRMERVDGSQLGSSRTV